MDLSQKQVRQLASSSQKQKLENDFLAHWNLMFPQLPAPKRQYAHNPSRKWRWDFAWPLDHAEYAGVLVDIQGGTFIRGGHSRGVGQDKDYEKWNDAVVRLYKPLLFGTLAMKHPEDVVTFVAEVLCNAK